MTETSSLYVGAGLLVMILIGYFFTTLVAPRSFSRRVACVFAPSMGVVVDRRIARNMGWVSGCAIVTLVLIGYFAVYVFTNYELRAHLDTSSKG